MKKKEALRVIAFVLCLVIGLSALTVVMNIQNRIDTNRLRGFNLEEKNSLDVVCIGASDMFTSFSSNVAWEKFGFTSYTYGVNGLRPYMLKPALKYVLERQSPKVVVIEINGMTYDEPASTVTQSSFQRVTDHMYFSKAKVETVNELIDDKDKVSCYWPLISNHSNWKSPELCLASIKDGLRLIKHGRSYLKGYNAYACEDNSKVKIYDVTKDFKKAPLSKSADYYLKDLMKYCSEAKIENVLFIRAPHRMTKSQYDSNMRVNTVEQVIKKNGFTFVNFDRMHKEIRVNDKKDFYNEGHMNIFGQLKFTEFLGKYLCDNYGVLNCQHDSEITDRWNEDTAKAMQAMEYYKKTTKTNKNRLLSEYDFDFSGDKVVLKRGNNKAPRS